MRRRIFEGMLDSFFSALGVGAVVGDMPTASAEEKPAPPAGIYSGDSVKVRSKGIALSPSPVPYGTDVKGVYFDGYPQMVKQEGSKPVHRVKVEKDLMAAMRDGVRIAVDVYRPDVGQRFAGGGTLVEGTTAALL